MDAGVGSYLNSDRTDQLVLRDGGGAKTKRQVRICVDLTCLNQSVCRERHTLPAVLDVNSGFWLIPLSPKSALLTTSITPDASSSSVWNFLSSGTFPAPHVRHPLWTGWCRMYDGRHPHTWPHKSRTRRATRTSFPLTPRGRNHSQMPVLSEQRHLPWPSP